LHVAATAAAAIAATVATAIAAAVATTMAAAVATITVMAATMAATVATIAAIATAAAVAKGQRLAVTTHEGNANQREEQSETKNNDAVHPQILQLLTGTVSENDQIAVKRRIHHNSRRPSVATRPGLCNTPRPSTRSQSLL
jgi:hypothetical protein